LPTVRLELRQGTATPTIYVVEASSFLIGTVPGCDLRLPGAALPAVSCLLTRCSDGVELRKLAPIQPLLVNGQPATLIKLQNGDRLLLGAAEVLIQIERAAPVKIEESREPAVQLVPLAVQVPEPTLPPPTPHDLAELTSQRAELNTTRQELIQIRQQLYERYRQRRDRLSGLREAVRRAARKVQEQKAQVEAEARVLASRREEESVAKYRLAVRAEELDNAERSLEQQRGVLAAREEEAQREVANRLLECRERERKLTEERVALEKSQNEHRAALARLDRAQAALEAREQRLRQSALETDLRFEQLQRDSREMEAQARQLDEWDAKHRSDAATLAKESATVEATKAQLRERSASLEGQQAVLASLRTRLERTAEHLRREEEILGGQRARVEETESELRRRTQELVREREELTTERGLFAEERRRVEEQGSGLETTSTQLRQTQEELTRREAALRAREEQSARLAEQQAEQGGLLRGRSDQLRDLQARLEAERQALRDRETALLQSEQGLVALQEQLRRRTEEIATRQRTQEEQLRRNEEALALAETRRGEIELERAQAQEQLAAARQQIEARAEELTRREQALGDTVERLKETGRNVGGERKSLHEERARWEAERISAEEALTKARAAHDAAQQQVAGLVGSLPELEARAASAAERLTQAREQLREHLGELHTYARQGRDDLEALRAQVREEAERLRQQEAALHRERDEHRLAVAAFRQQLIDWQAQVTEMKRSLAQGESQLERRQAAMDEQARQAEATSARLVRQAEELEQQQRLVTVRRSEVEQHLDDMRAWYRRKLRELTGRDAEDDAPASVVVTGSPDILSLTGEIDPGDRSLGDLMRTLQLVDDQTLNALLAEARRQRRSLRQLLLAGNHLTLYQMALIEAGNLDGLMLGPVRLIDRLRVTAREAVYRVFDPRRGHEALLRHLGEEEMQDAVRPDEFRQRFTSLAAVHHPNLSETLEVIEVADRPAVLQEWLTALPSGEWPGLVAVPGVWYRLLSQAALGLLTLHNAGLTHGRLIAEDVVLTAEATVKLCGAGEPGWLRVSPSEEEASVADDLRALGVLAAGWLELGGARKGKGKTLPDSLQAILDRLTTSVYPNVAGLLEDLERAGADVPANAAAWDRLSRQVRIEAVDTALRLSA
jgi:hypothetical protein